MAPIETILLVVAALTVGGMVTLRIFKRESIRRHSSLPGGDTVGEYTSISYHPAQPDTQDPYVHKPDFDETLIIGLGQETHQVLAWVKEMLIRRQHGLWSDQEQGSQDSLDIHLHLLAVGGHSSTPPHGLEQSKEWYPRKDDQERVRFWEQWQNCQSLYPHLFRWLVLQGSPGNDSALSQRVKTRLDLLLDLRKDNLSMLSKIKTKLRDLPTRTRVRVYLVANLGEPEGVALLTDVARLVSFCVAEMSPDHPVSLYAFVLLPDTNDVVTEEQASVFAAWRELDLAQLIFGQKPPGKTYYDAHLFQGRSEDVIVEHSHPLFSRCWLFDKGGPSRLHGVEPSKGIYPLIADTMVAHLVQKPWSDDNNGVQHHREMNAHHGQINNTRDNLQERLKIPLYSSVGTFTYHFPVDRIGDEIVERTIRDVIQKKLLGGNEDAGSTAGTYLRETHLGVSWHEAADLPESWDPKKLLRMADQGEDKELHGHRFQELHTCNARAARLEDLEGLLKFRDQLLLASVLAFILLAVTKGTLPVFFLFVIISSWVSWHHYPPLYHPIILFVIALAIIVLVYGLIVVPLKPMLAWGCRFINASEVVKKRSAAYRQKYLGHKQTAKAPGGEFRDHLNRSYQRAVAIERERLHCFVCDQLNAGVQLPAMIRFLRDLSTYHWEKLEESLKNHLQTCDAEVQQTNEQCQSVWDSSVVDCHESLQQGVRWLYGYTTTTHQERALEKVQRYINAEIDYLTTETVLKIVGDLKECSQELLKTLEDYRCTLNAEVERIETRLAGEFRTKRRKQLDFYRVRHEWGQPYVSLHDYRDYFDQQPHYDLPREKQRCQVVQGISAYLEGNHIDQVRDYMRRKRPDPDPVDQIANQIRWTCDSPEDDRSQETGGDSSCPCSLKGLIYVSEGHQTRDKPLPLNAQSLQQLARQVQSWVWDVSLGDLMADADPSQGVPSSQDFRVGIAPEDLACRFAEHSQSGLVLNYRDDGVVHATYALVVRPKMSVQGQQFFAQVENQHQAKMNVSDVNGCLYFQGSHPHQFVVLHEGEFLGVGSERSRKVHCEDANLLTYSNLALHYWFSHEQRRRLHLDIPHTIAAQIEGTSPVEERCLDPRVVACFFDRERLESFARLVLLDRIEAWKDDSSPQNIMIVKGEPGPVPEATEEPTPGKIGETVVLRLEQNENNDRDPSPWIVGLRYWCLGLDTEHRKQIAEIGSEVANSPHLSAPDEVDERLNSSERLRELKSSTDVAEKDLGLVVEALMRPLAQRSIQ
jgi:hypothetical protein